MVSALLTLGKFGNLFCGVEHTFTNGQEKLNVLLLRKKKDEFLIENTVECDKITKLHTQLQKGQHLFLIINNEKVLFKVEKGVYDTPEKAIAIAFPNLKAEDFYYEILQTDTHTFTAISRKDYINDILEQYNTNHLNVIGFSLGNLISSQLIAYIKDSSVSSSNASILFAENSIDAIERSENISPSNHTINDLNLSNKYVLSLAGIIAYFTNQHTNTTNYIAVNNGLLKTFKQKRIFNGGLKIGLSSVFVLLLVSFLFFSHYSSKINRLNNKLELNKTYKNSFIKLADQVDKKERLVMNFSLTSSKASWYLDQIGEALPHSIILSEIQFQPLEKGINHTSSFQGYEEKQLIFQENRLFIIGKSTNTTNFSNWIGNLEQQDWIEKVMIQEYGSGKKTSIGFTLQIAF